MPFAIVESISPRKKKRKRLTQKKHGASMHNIRISYDAKKHPKKNPPWKKNDLKFAVDDDCQFYHAKDNLWYQGRIVAVNDKYQHAYVIKAKNRNGRFTTNAYYKTPSDVRNIDGTPRT
jgi:hypothetical protein